jgi:hypothetical protein
MCACFEDFLKHIPAKHKNSFISLYQKYKIKHFFVYSLEIG